MIHWDSVSCFLNIFSASQYQKVSCILGVIAFQFQLAMFHARYGSRTFPSLLLISGRSTKKLVLEDSENVSDFGQLMAYVAGLS